MERGLNIVPKSRKNKLSAACKSMGVCSVKSGVTVNKTIKNYEYTQIPLNPILLSACALTLPDDFKSKEPYVCGALSYT